MTRKELEELLADAWNIEKTYEYDGTRCAEEMHKSIKQLVIDCGGCINFGKNRPGMSYNSGRYGKMNIVQLAICDGIMLANCEYEDDNGDTKNVWWSKAIEPIWTHLITFIAILDEIKDGRFCSISNPLEGEKVIWCV